MAGCEYCLDSEGENCFPYYGLRPHTHDMEKTGSFIGSTVMSPNAEPLPENFKPDSENNDFGTYTHCLKCGCHN